MSLVLWNLSARLCALSLILLAILGFRVSDSYADVSPFAETSTTNTLYEEEKNFARLS